jgi:hypothetical protein
MTKLRNGELRVRLNLSTQFQALQLRPVHSFVADRQEVLQQLRRQQGNTARSSVVALRRVRCPDYVQQRRSRDICTRDELKTDQRSKVAVLSYCSCSVKYEFPHIRYISKHILGSGIAIPYAPTPTRYLTLNLPVLNTRTASGSPEEICPGASASASRPAYAPSQTPCGSPRETSASRVPR